MTQKYNTELGQEPELQWVPIDAINVDHNYQRDIKPRRVGQIVREFEWSQFQPVMLARQPDGSFNVFDGQHRVEAARRHPMVDQVPAAIVDLDGTRAEAGAFIGVNNNRTSVTSIEKYHAGIEAGDPDMMAVCAVLEDAGCEVVQAQGLHAPNRTHAVTAVTRSIKHNGEDATSAACSAIRQAWPDDKHALKGIVITALSRIYADNSDIEQDRIVEVLAESGRDGLAANAEAMRKISGGDAARSIARTICELYNRGLRKNTIQTDARR